MVSKNNSRRGFTLLELMLALGLTTVILLAISMAVDLHLRSYDGRRKQLEESQLARAILKIIADDIRNTVIEYEQDLSGLEALITTAAEGGLGEATSSGESTGGNEAETSTSPLISDLTDDASAAVQDLASSVTVPAKPGIYGNQYQLQLDISRLPRFDEYQSMLAANNSTLGITDIPSDVKTVTYYVLNGGVPAGATGMTATNQDVLTSTDPDVVQRGLVRRQLDRAVSQYALVNGLLSATDSWRNRRRGSRFDRVSKIDGIEWRYGMGYRSRRFAARSHSDNHAAFEAPSMETLASQQSQADIPTDIDATSLHHYRVLVLATGQLLPKRKRRPR
ncbi:MAG: prepilin-type N-terminal cleavage/methylation domain-containing protein [Planctomycetaceae bacterium]|nr:prepilin-type N-terminal cleavage/methylation domain-containing protein [Planctomycetaceae bacterium]